MNAPAPAVVKKESEDDIMEEDIPENDDDDNYDDDEFEASNSKPQSKPVTPKEE